MCVYIYISPASCVSFPSAPIPPLCVITEHQAELPVLFSTFALAICCTVSVYMSMLVSLFVSLSPFSMVSTDPFSTFSSLFLPYKQAHMYHFSGFHIYALIYDIFLFLTSLCVTDSRSIHVYKSNPISSLFCGWVIFHCIYVLHLLYPFICRWMFRLLPPFWLWKLGCTCLFELWFSQGIPTPVRLPGKSHGRRSLVGCSPWGL